MSSLNEPFAHQTENDHAAALWVAAILCGIFTLIGMLTRAYVRYKAVGIDDWVILGGSIFAITQYALIFAGLSRGLGKATDTVDEQTTSIGGQVIMFFRESTGLSLIVHCLRSSWHQKQYSSLRFSSSRRPSSAQLNVYLVRRAELHESFAGSFKGSLVFVDWHHS